MSSRSSVSTLLLLICSASTVSSKLICDVYTHVEYQGRIFIQSNELYTYECESPFDKCCENGCCPNPWYALLFLGAFSLIVLVVVLMVIYCLNIIFKMIYNIRTLRHRPVHIVNTRTKTEGAAEPPPDYDVAIYLPVPQRDDNLPTFEEATIPK